MVSLRLNWHETCLLVSCGEVSPRGSEPMKTAKYLALIWFAVTVLSVGAWAQAYPDQGRDGRGQAPGQNAQGQGSPDQGAPDQDQQDQSEQTFDQTQGPQADGAPGQGEATKSEGPAP